MQAVITHRVEVTSIQKATALRDKVTDLLDEDEDVTVIHAGAADDSDVAPAAMPTPESPADA